jgi:hypothetical protein
MFRRQKGVPTQPSLLYVKPHVYAISDGGIVTCYKAADGEIVYQHQDPGPDHGAKPGQEALHVSPPDIICMKRCGIMEPLPALLAAPL